MGHRRKLVFKTTDTGCIICTSHSMNGDGYFRISDYRVKIEGHKPMVMHHRLVWEEVHGPIKPGYEIDHKCRNRGCQNIEHLQLLTRSEHATKTNKERSRKK